MISSLRISGPATAIERFSAIAVGATTESCRVDGNGHDLLLTRAQAGDERACHELFLRHRDDVVRIVFRTLGPDADLDDIVQEAFVQIFKSLGSFRGTAKFSTWLYRVVSNVARMHLRARRVRPVLTDGIAPDAFAARGDGDHGPERGAERAARIRALYEHIGVLSEKKRAVLVLHDFEGLLPKEIAEIVDAPVLTVRTRLFYARRELYAALGRDPRFDDLAGDLALLTNTTTNPSSNPSSNKDEP